jgi:hypothetical protein
MEHFNISWNDTDFRVTAGTSVAMTDGEGLTHAPRWAVRLTMAPGTARDFLNMLAEAIKRFEARYGTIPSEHHGEDDPNAGEK